MPDIQNLVITPLANANINNFPRAQISGQVVRSSAPFDVLANFTGANAFIFPTALSTLTAAERLELLNLILIWWLQKRSPAAWQ